MRERADRSWSAFFIILAILALVGLTIKPDVMAQTTTATPTAGTTVTTAATTATVAATTAATSTTAATATRVATTAVMTPTVAATTATVAATVARPTPVRAVVLPQATLPTTRTITLTGLIQVPAEAAPQSGAMARTITVVGEGSVSGAPDTVVALVGVETISDTVRLAADENSRIMTAVMTALRGQAIAQDDIQTTGLAVYSERQPGPQAGSPEVTRYHVVNNVRITVRRLDTLSAVLDAAISAGANSINGVNFSISDPSAMMAQAREKAMANALDKATALAGLANVQVGPVLQVSEMASGGPIPLAQARDGLGGGGLGPISSGQMEITDQVQVVFAIQ